MSERIGIAPEEAILGTRDLAMARAMWRYLAPHKAILSLALVLLATMILTEFIPNNAAAALMVPIGLVCARQVGMEAHPFMLAVTLGASMSFITPIGYQTNLIVQGAGGYRFTDFMRIVSEQIAPYVTNRRFLALGTDGMGRSDTREALRRFFETDAEHVAVAVLTMLIGTNGITAQTVANAINELGIDADAENGLTRD